MNVTLSSALMLLYGIAVAGCVSVESVRVAHGREPEKATVADPGVQGHSCEFVGDSSSVAAFVDEALYTLTDLRGSVVTWNGNPSLENRSYHVDCTLKTLRPFVESPNDAIRGPATRWSQASQAILEYFHREASRLPGDFGKAIRSDHRKAEAYWKDFIRPTKASLDEIAGVLREIRDLATSAPSKIDSETRTRIVYRHWPRYCDPAWLSEFRIPSDDSWTVEACTMLRALSDSQSRPAFPGPVTLE